ncbi:hypothetical protein P7B02_11080 [Caulobacter segnis]|uniref:hypothetical protein n=1 Tax=Caulobacter segnis TaxID=88688 RepID=UPI0024109676|nr:hypothetical protein [Caulobacter segnis]MDG2522082.1 hypothetical protein [Caulobacter segnis]
MRAFAATLVFTAFTAGAALAAPVSEITVSIGPELAKKTPELGARELDDLRGDLKRTVERELERAGQLNPQGGRLDLVIADARPNRPTMQQMARTPGLSYQSFSIGGASVTGSYSAPGGASTPVSYSWYENDIREAWWRGTWGDANRAFDRFASKFAKGETLAAK